MRTINLLLPAVVCAAVFAGCAGGVTPSTLPGMMTAFGDRLKASDGATETPPAHHMYVQDVGPYGKNSDPCGRVYVYPIAANGDVAPSRTIESTALCPSGTGISHLTVDSKGYLYVVVMANASPAVAGSVQIFAPGANGNDVAPVGEITHAESDGGRYNPEGVAIDVARQLVYVFDQESETLEVYPAGAAGGSKPVRAIAGSKAGFSGNISDLSVDPGSGNVYVNIPATNTIAVFPAKASGDVKPSRTIGFQQYDLGYFEGNTVGPNSHDLYLSDYRGEVLILPPKAHGQQVPGSNVALSGKLTQLNVPIGVASDTAENLFVVNLNTPSVTVYHNVQSGGNIAPIHTISGTATGLAQPKYIAVGP